MGGSFPDVISIVLCGGISLERLLQTTANKPTMLRTTVLRRLHDVGSSILPFERAFGSPAWRGAHVSGGLSHRRPKTIVDQVPPESIRAAARDIACRAFDVHVLAVGTCAIN